jgi:hypothetical protein
VLCGDEHYVVLPSAGKLKSGKIERLRVYVAVDR